MNVFALKPEPDFEASTQSRTSLSRVRPKPALVSPLTGGKVTGCRFAKNDGRVRAIKVIFMAVVMCFAKKSCEVGNLTGGLLPIIYGIWSPFVNHVIRLKA